MKYATKYISKVRRRASIVKSRLVGSTYHDLEPEFLALSERVDAYTMTSIERRYALWKAVGYVLDSEIEGDLVECGVWRGGSSMLIARMLTESGDDSRVLWLYDTFEGMSLPSEYDVDRKGRRMVDTWHQHLGQEDDEIFAFSPLEEVGENMASTGFPADRVKYVKGMVEETLPDQIPEKVALLRVDTDWYESTRHELEFLWPRLVSGGVLIIDDYGHWAGARKAVDEFFANCHDAPLLSRIDEGGRIAVKR